MPIKGGGSGGGVTNLSDLADVNALFPTNNQALTWDSGTSKWIPETLAGGVTEINDLSDVTITAVADNQILRYDTGGGIWQNETPPWISDITGEDLSTLSDVTITSIASNEILQWTGAAWINRTLTEAGIAAASHTHLEADITDLQSYLLNITAEPLSDLSDVTITSIAASEILQWTGSVWINRTLAEAGIAASGHTHAIDDLTDVTITSVADNQILRYDTGGGIWQNETPPWISDITGEDLSTLQDVTITSIGNNEILVWETDHWENQTLAEAGISVSGHTHDFTDLIPCTLENPQGTVAYPDYRTLATGGTKISGFVMPDGASKSKINFKCVIPDNLASTPAMKIRIRIITLTANSDHAIRLTLGTKGFAINENIDVTLTTETEVTAEMPNATETMNEAQIEIDLTTDWVTDDTVVGQVERDPTDAVDDYAGDVMIVGIDLVVDRTAT